MKTVNHRSFTIPAVLFMASVALFLQSCGGSTIYFEQTCIECVTSQWMVSKSICADSVDAPIITKGDNAVQVYTMIPETGEILDLSFIVQEEAEYGNHISPAYGKRVAIAKLKGKYYLTGDDFNFLWILTPAGQDRASIEKILLPEGSVKEPVFKIDISRGRFDPVLIFSATNYTPKYYLDSENEWKKM